MDNLKGGKILIGREPAQNRLLVAIHGGKAAAIGNANSVPTTVSRCRIAENIAHAQIEIDQTGNMILSRMNPANPVSVNGLEIFSKRIQLNDSVYLGPDGFPIDLPLVIETAKKLANLTSTEVKANTLGTSAVRNESSTVNTQKGSAKVYNIKHLERIWDSFESEIDRIALQQQEASKKRMLPIMIGSLSGVASPILATLVAANTLIFTVPVAAVSFGLYFMSYRKKDTSYEDKKNATERLIDEYVCPNPDCNKFFGNISYKLLKKQYSMQCPHCKCKFVEK